MSRPVSNELARVIEELRELRRERQATLRQIAEVSRPETPETADQTTSATPTQALASTTPSTLPPSPPLTPTPLESIVVTVTQAAPRRTLSPTPSEPRAVTSTVTQAAPRRPPTPSGPRAVTGTVTQAAPRRTLPPPPPPPRYPWPTAPQDPFRRPAIQGPSFLAGPANTNPRQSVIQEPRVVRLNGEDPNRLVVHRQWSPRESNVSRPIQARLGPVVRRSDPFIPYQRSYNSDRRATRQMRFRVPPGPPQPPIPICLFCLQALWGFRCPYHM